VDPLLNYRPFQRDRAGLIALCLLLAAFNLRPALTSLATMLGEVQRDLRISSFSVGLLTMAPVLCFGVFGPLGPLLAGRVGLERALSLVLLLLAASLGVRALAGHATLGASTLAAGAAIGMAGVLLPVIIRRDFPRHLGLVTGLYTMVLSVGGSSAAGLTPLLARETGSWTFALAAWGIPAFAAAVLWGGFSLRREKPIEGRLPQFFTLLRDPVAWSVTGFMGLQAALAFIVLGWLPSLLQDRGLGPVEAGIVTSVSIIAQTVTALLVPSLADRWVPAWLLVLVVLLAASGGFVGLIYGPVSTGPLWALGLGLGQGGLFGLALLFISLRSPSPEAATKLSGMSQSIGYIGASSGPLLVGSVREAGYGTGGSTLVFLLVSVLCCWCGLQAARPKYALKRH
jgi:MFS transporter, CP family, cyanate transporter